MLKRSLNLDLLEFHVREAAQELDLLLDSIQYARDGTLREGDVGDEPLRWPCGKVPLPLRLNTPTTISTSRGTGGSRRCGKRIRSSIETRNSPVRAIRSAGSRSSGRRL